MRLTFYKGICATFPYCGNKPNKITFEKIYLKKSLLLYIRAIIRHFLLAAFPCGTDAAAFFLLLFFFFFVVVAFFAENRYVVIFFYADVRHQTTFAVIFTQFC